MTHCPKCRAEMNPSELDGLPASACTACGGLWLAREFLELWAQRLGRKTDALQLKHAPSSTTTLHCPDCAIDLERVEAHELQIEHCPQCHGVFFDPGELAAIARVLTADRAGPERRTFPGPPGATRPASKPAGDQMIDELDQDKLWPDEASSPLKVLFGIAIFDVLGIFFDH